MIYSRPNRIKEIDRSTKGIL